MAGVSRTSSDANAVLSDQSGGNAPCVILNNLEILHCSHSSGTSSRHIQSSTTAQISPPAVSGLNSTPLNDDTEESLKSEKLPLPSDHASAQSHSDEQLDLAHISEWRQDSTATSPKQRTSLFEMPDPIYQGKMYFENVPRSSKQGRRFWDELDVNFMHYDQGLVQKWKEQMDTLLVFAGLFSGVVTAFIVQFYTNLTGTASSNFDPSTAMFSSSDLARLIRPDGTLPPEFRLLLQTNTAQCSQSPNSTTVVNSLWFSSLVYSLIAASLATLVKQWVHHYKAEIYATPRERSRIREHRFVGVRKWCLPEIVAFLPLLLRAALTLFLIGVIVFLKSLSTTVMWVVTVPIIVWFVAYSTSIIVPIFFSNCPYKSPESSIIYLLSRVIVEGPRPSLRRIRQIAWKDREHRLRKDSNLDISMLVTADLIFADETLATTIRQCVSELDQPAIIEVIRRILCNRLQVPIDFFRYSTRDAELSKYMTLTGKCVTVIMDILMDTLGREITRQIGPKGSIESTVLNFSGVIVSCLAYITNVLQYSKGIDDTAFDERLLELLRELMIPERTFNVTVWYTIGILQSRPELYQSGLATKYMTKNLYKLSRVAWNTSAMGRYKKCLPVCAIILRLWSHATQDVLRVHKNDFSILIYEIAASIMALTTVEEDDLVEECLDSLMTLEQHLDKASCVSLSDAFLGNRQRIVRSHKLSAEGRWMRKGRDYEV